MSDINITIPGGTSKRLLTGGKYCDKDIVVTAEGGGGDSEENLLDARLNGTITEINSAVTSISGYACRALPNLTRVHLPNVTSIGTYAFHTCPKLKVFEAPNLTTAGTYWFAESTGLVEIALPKLTTIANASFNRCTSLVKADFAIASSIGTSVFYGNSKFTTLILRRTAGVCTLAGTNSLTGTPIASGTGYIYIPAALMASYETASQWSTYANQFRAIEDYPDICG